jgi:hypothetical protein
MDYSWVNLEIVIGIGQILFLILDAGSEINP